MIRTLLPLGLSAHRARLLVFGAFCLLACSGAPTLDPGNLCDGSNDIRFRAAVTSDSEDLLNVFANSAGAPLLMILGTCRYYVSGSAWGLTKTGILSEEGLVETLEKLQYPELGELHGSWGSGCYDPPLLQVSSDPYVVNCYCFCERNAPASARALGANFDEVISALTQDGTYWNGPLRLLVIRRPEYDGDMDTLVPWPLAMSLADVAVESSDLSNDGVLREDLLEGVLISDPDDVRALRETLQSTKAQRYGGMLSVYSAGRAYDIIGRDELDGLGRD